jgi:hypothetical protein
MLEVMNFSCIILNGEMRSSGLLHSKCNNLLCNFLLTFQNNGSVPSSRILDNVNILTIITSVTKTTLTSQLHSMFHHILLCVDIEWELKTSL